MRRTLQRKFVLTAMAEVSEPDYASGLFDASTVHTIDITMEDWGLYLAVEAVEESFLERNYGGGQGELYKPDSMDMGGGKGAGGDFAMPEAFSQEDLENMEPPEGMEVPENFDPSSMEPPEGFDPSNREAPEGEDPMEGRGGGGGFQGGGQPPKDEMPQKTGKPSGEMSLTERPAGN